MFYTFFAVYEVLVLPDVFEDGIPSQLPVIQIKRSHILTLHVFTDPSLLGYCSSLTLSILCPTLGCTHLQNFF